MSERAKVLYERRKTLIMLAFLLFPIMAGAQTFDVTAEDKPGGTTIVSIAWIADGAGNVSGNFDTDKDNLSLTHLYGYLCGGIVTIPGAPAPAALYDIVVRSGDPTTGLDIFGAGLIDRSDTIDQIAPPLIGSAIGEMPYYKTWTISISGAGAGGSGLIEVALK